MISDEMRELVSAYVDDELRPQDAARVEELAKRDPELRKEIEDVRRLGRKLKAWDLENRHEPRPTLKRRAVDRARTFLLESRAAAKGRVLRLAFHPVAIAATLLVAAAVGVLAGRDAPVSTVEFARVDVGPVAPVGDLTVDATLAPAPPLPGYEALPAWDWVKSRLRGRWHDGAVLSDRAIRFLEEQESEIQKWEIRKTEQERVVVREEAERRRTGPWHPEAVRMLDAFRPGGEAVDGVVTVRRPADPDLPRFVAARAAEDGPDSDILRFDTSEDRTRVLVPLGEVWIGARDKSLRTRVVAVSNVVFDSEHLASAWADRVPYPYDSHRLDAAEFILGPEARRRLLSVRGKDEAFVAWLHKRYGAGSLAEAYARGAAAREKQVKAFIEALDADREATGFVVLASDGRVLGMELFADHALMMEFAPRLLHGYLIESGDAIRLKRPKGADTLGIATRALGDVAQRTVKVEEVADRGTTESWPKALPGLRRINLRNGTGEIIAHGILNGDRPIHLAVFE